MSRLLLVVALCALPSAGLAADAMSGYRNLGFEQGTEGWGVWYSDDPNDGSPHYPYVADEAQAHSGKRSLKIAATAPGGRAFVYQRSQALKPNTRYEVSYWYLPVNIDEARFTVLFNMRQKLPGGKLGKMRRLNVMLFKRPREGRWRQRVGRIRTFKSDDEAQLGIYLRDTVGTVWVDDVVVREITQEQDAVADMWEYDPHRVELLRVPELKFRKLVADKAPILELAKAYNWALVRSAYAKDEVQRFNRVALYATSFGFEFKPAQFDDRCNAMEDTLANLYRLYGRAHLDQTDQAAAVAFVEAAAKLGTASEGLRNLVRRAVADVQRQLRAKGVTWRGQPEPLKAGLPEIAPDGTPNQIIYGTRSLWNHGLMEEPLDINTLHSITIGWPKSTKPGHYDWSAYAKQWQDMTDFCPTIQRGCLPIWFAVHDTTICPKWLFERMKTDPELMLQTHPPQPFRQRPGRMRTQLNWWHPDIQAYARELLTDMGRTFKPRKEFLFYVDQAECAGPVVHVEGKPWRREVGYSSHGKRSFRAWLKRKYGAIGKLNDAWKARYASFDAVEPPPDKFLAPRKQATPLSAEWEAWREESFADWCKLIYDTLKKADGKPILASHSQLLTWVNAARAYETCDILGYHNRSPYFMANTLYINTISRYNGFRPVGQYENFWGCQEHHDRMGEERAQRHNMQKHVFRLTAWSRFVQIWWYAYTTADYLTTYDGNWFDPVYALTTLRYRSAGLPVYKDKFKRLERAMLGSRLAHHRICVLQPSASMRNQYPHNATMTEIIAWFELLFPRNYLFEIVPEEYLDDGRAKLADFDVLILPYAVYLPRKLEGQIGAWLSSGKRALLSSGPFGVYDEIARPRGQLFGRLFKGHQVKSVEPPEGGWAWPDGRSSAAFLRSKEGASECIALLQPLARVRKALSKTLLDAIEGATDRLAYSRDDRFELVVRDASAGTRCLLVLNPDVDEPHQDVVTIQGAYTSAEDIDIPGAFPIALDRRDGATSFRLRLAPCEMAVIRLTP